MGGSAMTRTLKLHTRFSDSKSNLAWKRMQPPKEIPELVLKGKWLDDLGFLPGLYVKVTHIDNEKLLIELL